MGGMENNKIYRLLCPNPNNLASSSMLYSVHVAVIKTTIFSNKAINMLNHLPFSFLNIITDTIVEIKNDNIRMVTYNTLHHHFTLTKFFLCIINQSTTYIVTKFAISFMNVLRK